MPTTRTIPVNIQTNNDLFQLQSTMLGFEDEDTYKGISTKECIYNLQDPSDSKDKWKTINLQLEQRNETVPFLEFDEITNSFSQKTSVTYDPGVRTQRCFTVKIPAHNVLASPDSPRTAVRISEQEVTVTDTMISKAAIKAIDEVEGQLWYGGAARVEKFNLTLDYAPLENQMNKSMTFTSKALYDSGEKMKNASENGGTSTLILKDEFKDPVPPYFTSGGSFKWSITAEARPHTLREGVFGLTEPTDRSLFERKIHPEV